MDKYKVISGHSGVTRSQQRRKDAQLPCRYSQAESVSHMIKEKKPQNEVGSQNNTRFSGTQDRNRHSK